MDGARVQDLISRGMGTAARMIGVRCDAYRPSDSGNPLAPCNRFLQLTAAFNATDPSFRRGEAYGRPVWYGVFDSAYTGPGDYLVECGGARRWFVAAQAPLLPVVCVLTNRIVSFHRPAGPSAAGINSYGGVQRTELVPLLINWPASILAGGTGEREPAELPSDVRLGGYSVLLPAAITRGCPVANALLRTDDLMNDDLGRTYVVSSAELSELGWRLLVKLATT
ncbi:MAG: hypothetical protein JO047_04830 [Alphaproteobacteria bacterium]|nr:hypothetical protein [Alphaproteobacteria bacterium]